MQPSRSKMARRRGSTPSMLLWSATPPQRILAISPANRLPELERRGAVGSSHSLK